MIMAHENALKADAALRRWWPTYKGDKRFVDLPSRDQPPELVEVKEIFGHVRYENFSEVQGQQTTLVPALTELRKKTDASFPVDPDITAMPSAAWAALFPDEPGYQIKGRHNRTSSPELSLKVHRKNLGTEMANAVKEFARQVQTERKKTILDIPTQDETFTIYDMKKEGRSDVDIAQAIWPDEYKKAIEARRDRDMPSFRIKYNRLLQRVANRYQSACESIEQSIHSSEN
jgi:hypothetical protein